MLNSRQWKKRRDPFFVELPRIPIRNVTKDVTMISPTTSAPSTPLTLTNETIIEVTFPSGVVVRIR